MVVRNRSPFRPELQGLRALAIVLVVIYHLWLNRVSGGVDVFFVVSGFLLTGQLVRALENGPLDLRKRWSQVIVRLVPTTTVVLTATVIASVLILPPGHWPQTIREVVASALFLENWQLAANSVDYSTSNNMASVVQQLWSLSIQAQFFVVWPVVIAGIAFVARITGGPVLGWLTVTVMAVLIASLAFSVSLTASQQPLAYFHLGTRIWEFAVGAILALYIDRITAPRLLRVAVGWLGVIGLIVCGIVLDARAAFPGFAALWPAGCATLVLLAGSTGTRWGADRLLASRPARHIGDLSFTLYLWHWPVLVLYLVSTGRETVGIVAGLALVGLSYILAITTYRLVEKPLMSRRLAVGTGYRLGMACLAGILVLGAGWQAETTRRADVPIVTGTTVHPGAIALTSGGVDPAPLLPSTVSIYDDWVPIQSWDCVPLAYFAADRCTQPVAFAPQRQIVVVGDSHIQQLGGALLPIAEQRQWQLTFILRGACPYSTVSEVNPDDGACVDWNSAVNAEILVLRPDAVVTLATRNVRAGLTEQTPVGFVEQWRWLDMEGIPVLAMRDNPRFDSSMPDCVERGANDEPPCGIERHMVYSPDPPWTQIPDLPSNVVFLDVADTVCESTFCPAVIGNIFVYMDDNHLTATYSSTMASPLEEAIIKALGF